MSAERVAIPRRTWDSEDLAALEVDFPIITGGGKKEGAIRTAKTIATGKSDSELVNGTIVARGLE
jgi:hypothetical protein